MKTTARILTAAAYLACIVLANYATSRYGFVWCFGFTAVAGTYFAGLSFVARDAVQDTWAGTAHEGADGRWAVLGVIVAGAVLSWWVSNAALALASGVTFLVSESSDWLVYSPLRKRGYLRAAVASNIVGAVVDTFLFLHLAHFPIAPLWQGQLVGKLACTAAVIALVAVVRLRLRRPVTA